MIRMFVRHPVADFDKWKQSYDAFDATRQGLGVQGAAGFKGAPDPNEVTVWHDFASIDAAKAFLESEELASAMKEAGVLSEPMVWFAERDLP
jgi:hypothetical protein